MFKHRHFSRRTSSNRSVSIDPLTPSEIALEWALADIEIEAEERDQEDDLQSDQPFQTYEELEQFTLEKLIHIHQDTLTRPITEQDIAYAESLVNTLNAFTPPTAK